MSVSQLLLVMLIGYVIFCCYSIGMCLQAAVLLQKEHNQPDAATLEKIIRHLDHVNDMGLVDLPTREVLRRCKERKLLEASASTSTPALDNASTAADTAAGTSNTVDKTALPNAQVIDPRTSKEAQEKLAVEAFKASIPTKEMEVIEWEQALFRAAKRSLAKAKTPSQKTQKLIKSIQFSSRLNVQVKGG